VAEGATNPRGFVPAIGRLALRLAGWRIAGAFPDLPRFVIVVAPHTSNWDFPVGLAAKFALGLRADFLGKHTLFRWPLGWVLRRLGGIPVNRAQPEGVIEAVEARMRSEPTFVLVIAPEGTRKRTTGWKTGFHRIALATGVPIVPVWFDWSTRTVGIGAPVMATADMAGDIARLRTLYTRNMARCPANFADVRDEAPSP